MSERDDVAGAVGDHTTPSLLRRAAVEHGDLPALTSGSGTPQERTWRWAELRAEVAAAARGLADAGLARGERLLIMASSRPEHVLADHAAAHVGALPCTAYDTLAPEQIAHIARHSGATVAVLEGRSQLDRWLPVLGELPALRLVVVLAAADLAAITERTAGADAGGPRFVTWDAVLARGRELHAAEPAVFEELAGAVRQADPVAMIYTSGTTGEPKGVVLSHRNVVWQAAASDALQPGPIGPRTVAYLPLAHIAERMLALYLPLWRAGHVTLCPDPAELPATLRRVRPHGFFGVPRVWERFAAGVQAQLAALPPDARAAVDEARAVAARAYRVRGAGGEPDAALAARLDAVDAAVLRPLRAGLGLDEAVRVGSGAAPIPVAVLEFLGSVGVTVVEVWGLSETTGAATTNRADRYVPGSVGTPVAGVELRVAGDGEVLVRGETVFLGYLRADGGIDPAVDADGWLATGDVGVLDGDGFLTIVDRKKELIVTATGKNVAPSAIEGLLRAHPLIAQAVAIGDRRPHVTALIVLDDEAAPPWARARGIDGVAGPDLARHPAVLAEIAATVDAANARLSRPEQIRRHVVLGTPWTATTGELTPTLKLRRRAIAERYAAEIDALYA